MKQHFIKNLCICAGFMGFSNMLHAEDFHIQTGGRSVKVLAPSGSNRGSEPAKPRKQGLWFIEDERKKKAEEEQNLTNIQTADSVEISTDESTRIIPLKRERFTVGEARARLDKAKRQLQKDKDILARYQDEADPNKLELWRARIATTEKLISEKEMALRRIENRYIQRLRMQRDARIYKDQNKFYKNVGAKDTDLSFK